MPVKHALWKMGENTQQLSEGKLENEQELEDMIAQDVSVLSDEWLLIGRQVLTAYSKKIDILALDTSGSIIIVELKRNRTPREVVAQIIDYASWVKNLDASEIAEIFEGHKEKLGYEAQSLDQIFLAKFGTELVESDLNSSHQMVIVATELDSSTERIVQYLSDFNIAINVVFFRIFQDGRERYLSRAWFIDPSETLERATMPRGNEPWNGEFYVSFGHGESRNWNDARKFGFISAGGGRWYTNTLHKLKPGDRIWVNIPRKGYAGVGIVESPVVKVDKFMVEIDGEKKPLLQVVSDAHYHREYVENEDMAEYVVGVKWLKTIPMKNVKSEVGLFGNQNTVAQPTTAKWPHTVERLKQLFGIE